jgi:FkbM family methyltransferase
MKDNYELLVENINENNLDNIWTFNIAVSNSETVKLYINDDQSGHSMFSESSNFITTNSISLQKIFDENSIEYCNFLKLDCEGAEYEIIENLPSVYFERIEKIVIEYHMADSHPELLSRLKKKLESKNYKIEIKELFTDIGFLYAKRN